MTSAVLVFDGEPADGLGHRRRMETLAAALRDVGIDIELVASGGLPVATDVIVVDSYRFRADDAGRFAAGVIVALDDLDRDLHVDVVVDPSPGASADTHRAATHVMAGPEYALVDRSLDELETRDIGPDVGTVLVATGGADSEGVGAGLARFLATLLPGVEVCLALGPGVTADTDDRVTIVRTVAGLGPYLAKADLVVTAAGVTLLESLALGRPTVAVVLADNQRQAADGAAAAGAAAVATIDEAAPMAAGLAGDYERRVRMSAEARTLVDGQGARRVAEAVAALVTS